MTEKIIQLNEGAIKHELKELVRSSVKVYTHIDAWRERRLSGSYSYVYLDGIYLKRNWGGEYENVSVLMAIGVDADGYREVIGAAEGMKEDSESWLSFLRSLKERGLSGCQLFIGDRNIGLLEAVTTVFPQAKYQRCTVHFYRNMFSVTPRSKVRTVAAMLKAIHAQEDKKAALEKAGAVSAKLREMKLREAADKLDRGIGETLTDESRRDVSRRTFRPDAGMRQGPVCHEQPLGNNALYVHETPV